MFEIQNWLGLVIVTAGRMTFVVIKPYEIITVIFKKCEFLLKLLPASPR
jgi:hypothetical protein